MSKAMDALKALEDRMIEQKAEQKGWIEIRGRKFRVIEINGMQGEDIGGGE